MTTEKSNLDAKSITVGLTADDVGRSLAFYEALGFGVTDRWEENGQLTGVMLRAGNCMLGLSQDDWKKGRDRKKGVGTRVHIETAQNIDDIATRAKAAGITLDSDPHDTEWKTRQFEVTDPTGFKLTISSEWQRS